MAATDETSGSGPGSPPSAPAGARAPGTLTTRELQEHIVETRARLADTLAALEDKARLSRHIGKASRAAAAHIVKMRRGSRLDFAVVVLGGGVIAGLFVAAVVKSVRKRQRS